MFQSEFFSKQKFSLVKQLPIRPSPRVAEPSQFISNHNQFGSFQQMYHTNQITNSPCQVASRGHDKAATKVVQWPWPVVWVGREEGVQDNVLMRAHAADAPTPSPSRDAPPIAPSVSSSIDHSQLDNSIKHQPLI